MEIQTQIDYLNFKIFELRQSINRTNNARKINLLCDEKNRLIAIKNNLAKLRTLYNAYMSFNECGKGI